MTGPEPPHLLVVGFPGSSDAQDEVDKGESWADRMSKAGYLVRTGRAGQDRPSRLADRVALVFASGRWADAIVVDTFPGPRFWTTFLIVRMARVLSRPAIVDLHGGALPQFVRDHARRADSSLRMASRVVTSSHSLHRQLSGAAPFVGGQPDLLAGPEPCAATDDLVVHWERVLTLCGIGRRPPPRDGCDTLGLRDLDEIVEIHRAAFPDSAITQLGDSVVRRYYVWQFIGPHPAPVALGVWNGGKLVGFLFGGIRQRAVVGFVHRYVGAIVVGAVRHPGAVRRLAAPKVVTVARLVVRRAPRSRPAHSPTVVGQDSTSSVSEPSFGVLAVAVRPSARGTGAAGLLMAEAERAAAAEGSTRMHLTVQVNNARAIAFYEKLGWVRQTPADGWQGAMTKSIEAARTAVGGESS